MRDAQQPAVYFENEGPIAHDHQKYESMTQLFLCYHTVTVAPWPLPKWSERAATRVAGGGHKRVGRTEPSGDRNYAQGRSGVI